MNLTARPDRRTRVLWIGEAELLDAAVSLLTGATGPLYRLRLVGLTPELQREWKVERVTHDWSRRAVGFLISHPSFPVVEDGMPSPDMTDVMRWEYQVVPPASPPDDDTGEFVAAPVDTPVTGYADPTKTYVPQWDARPVPAVSSKVPAGDAPTVVES